MYNLYLATLFFFYALLAPSAVFGHFKAEKPPPNATFHRHPPGKPTVKPEPIHALDPGQHYANPKDNPFNSHGALIYGPTKVVKLSNFTAPKSFNLSQPCHDGQTTSGGSGRLEDRWGKHLSEKLFRNGTVQQVGFSLDIFKKLQTKHRGSNRSVITRGRRVVYGDDHDDHDDHDNDDSKRVVKSDLEKKWIIGPDGRSEILNTWVFPYDTVGLVGGICTGTLVGPRHVLTAGHCVNSGGSSGKWFSDLDFTFVQRPGIDGKPFSTVVFKWEHVWSVKGWTQSGDRDYDYALITLADTGMHTPWMSFGYNDGLGDWIVNSNGYPGDKPSFTMWHTDGRITDTSDNHFDVDLDLVPGDSGSGVYVYLKDQSRIIYGIVSSQWTETFPNFPDFWNTHTNIGNRATRINEVRFNLICGWINAGIC